jgi:DedD protein
MRDDDFNLNDRDFKNDEYSEDNLRDINDINDLTESSDKSRKVMFIAILSAVVLVVAFVGYTAFFSGAEEENEDTAMEFLDESEPFFIDSPAPESDPMATGFEETPDDTFSKDELLEDSYSDTSYLEPIDDVVEKPEPTFEKRSEITPEPALPIVKEEVKVEETKEEKVVEKSPELVNQKKTYIQTGTFLKLHPNKKYLQSISDLNLQYHIDKYTSNGREVTRVLVGPFDSFQSAKDMLPTVQEKIEKSSFLITTKLH